MWKVWLLLHVILVQYHFGVFCFKRDFTSGVDGVGYQLAIIRSYDFQRLFRLMMMMIIFVLLLMISRLVPIPKRSVNISIRDYICGVD